MLHDDHQHIATCRCLQFGAGQVAQRGFVGAVMLKNSCLPPLEQSLMRAEFQDGKPKQCTLSKALWSFVEPQRRVIHQVCPRHPPFTLHAVIWPMTPRITQCTVNYILSLALLFKSLNRTNIIIRFTRQLTFHFRGNQHSDANPGPYICSICMK